jgi:hypothetical protein
MSLGSLDHVMSKSGSGSLTMFKRIEPTPPLQGIFGVGDVWTWVSIDADAKLVPCWHAGRRDGRAAYEFIKDLAGCLAHHVQLTTDGHRPHMEAVEAAFGCEIDYAMLVKIYGKPQEEVRAEG